MTPTAILVLATLIMQGTTQPARPPLLAGPRVTPEAAVGSEPVFRVLPGRRPAQFPIRNGVRDRPGPVPDLREYVQSQTQATTITRPTT